MKLRSFLALALVCATACIARAQPLDALKAIPDDADGFAVIAKLGAFDKKAVALGKKLGAPPIGLLDAVKQFTGIGKGIDLDGSLAVIAFAGDGEKPAVVLAVAVSDYEELAKSLKAKDAGDGTASFQILGGKEGVLAKKGNFALASAAEHSPYLLKVLKSRNDVVEKTQELHDWLKAQDVAIVVLEKTVKKGAKTLAEKIPDQLPNVPEEQEKVLKQQLAWIQLFAKSVGEEATHVAVGIGIDDDGNARKSLRVGYAKDGRFSKWGKTQPKEHPLAGLPANPSALAIGYSISPESMRSLLAFSIESSKETYKLTPEQAKELENIYVDSMSGFDAMSFLVQVPKDGALMGGIVGVLRGSNSKAYLEKYAEAIAKADKIIKVGHETKNVKIDGKDAIEVTMDLKSVLKNVNDPNAEVMLEKLFGASGKMSFTVVAVDSKTALFGYVTGDKMKKLTASYAADKALTTDATAVRTLKLLSPDAFLVVLWSPQETAKFAGAVAKEFGQELPIPAVGATPPIGLAVRGTATFLEVQFAVPTEVIAEIGKLVQLWTTQ